MGPYVRVLLHMIGFYLASLGHIPEDIVRDIVNDPELIGAIVIAITWIWYYLAKKLGWRT
ncbi:MAG TPA: hypothetical protein VL020_06135, partial [Pseudomonadales bacterium]|nr:hypothetical protein [Pseudomonadales bacterium]